MPWHRSASPKTCSSPASHLAPALRFGRPLLLDGPCILARFTLWLQDPEFVTMLEEADVDAQLQTRQLNVAGSGS